MTLEQYIQIAILIVLAVLLWRDNRLEKRREAEKARDLASSFNNLKDCLADGLQTAVETIKKNTDSSVGRYGNLIDSDLQGIDKVVCTIPSTLSTLSTSSTKSTQSILSFLDNLQTKLLANLQTTEVGLNSQLSTLHSQLLSIQTPIRLWGEAQTKHVINEGEANRTLRKKLQDKREILAQMNSQISDLSSQLKSTRTELDLAKSEAAGFIAALVEELNFVRSWLDAKGMPLSALDKALNLEFKDHVPSREYHKVLAEKQFHASVGANCGSPSQSPESSPSQPLPEASNA